MRRKLVVLFLALLMTSTAIVGVLNHRNGTVSIASAAEGSSGGGNGLNYQPIINYSYVWKKTYNLSMIVKEPNCSKGRAFGTLGEHKAANRIQQWMNGTLGSENVTRDKISKRLTVCNAVANKGFRKIGLYWGFGRQDRRWTLVNDTHWIWVRVINKSTGRIAEEDGKKLSWNLSVKNHTCFSLIKTWMVPGEGNWFDLIKSMLIGEDCIFKTSHDNLLVITPDLLKEAIMKSIWKGERLCLILNAHWKNPYEWILSNATYKKLLKRKIKAFILVDHDFNNTFFMSPSLPSVHPKAGFSINGYIGRKIEEYIHKEGYEVRADICSKWKFDHVKSYNVIGKLSGENHSKVDIVCAHYDCWWNQGAIDEAGETALVLGIARYMKDIENETHIKPKYDVKFIAFAGEEFGFRGTIDYIKKYVKSGEEAVRYVINPGNFGHNDSKYLEGNDSKFQICTNREDLGNIVKNIAEGIRYTELPDIEWGIMVNRTVEGEDAEVFNDTGYAEGCIQFSRNPFKGYHRDGNNHTEGDVIEPKAEFCGIVNGTFAPECDIVLLTSLYLCYDDKLGLNITDHSIETFDSGEDGKNDTVRIYYNVTSIIPNVAKVVAKAMHNPTGDIISDRSRYFLVRDGEKTSGYLTLRLGPDDESGKYNISIELLDAGGKVVDREWVENVSLYTYDMPVAQYDIYPEEPTSAEDVTADASSSIPSPGESGTKGSYITNYTWDFGDGTTAYGKNVTHRFPDDGYYNVTLTVYDSNGKSASKTVTIYVKNTPPKVDFSVEPSEIVAVGERVYFNASVYDRDGYITNITYDFGDENLAYEQNTSHVYTKSGLYRVRLAVRDDDNDTTTEAKWIWVFDGIVDDNYSRDDPANGRWKSIQNAINDLDDGAMIYVYSGIYNESLIIDKAIEIYGESRGGTIITNPGTIIDISENGSLFITNLTIKGGSTGVRVSGEGGGNMIHYCNIYQNDVGIFLYGRSCNELIGCDITSEKQDIKIVNSGYNHIENCSITGAKNGIYLENASDNNIYYCSFRSNDNAIYLYDSRNNTIGSCYMEMKNATASGSGLFIIPVYIIGIRMVDSDYNLISSCKIYNASHYAIHMVSSSHNLIASCNISENGAGIYMVGSLYNVVQTSIFYKNENPAIILDISSRNNSIYRNVFLMNGETGDEYIQAYDDGEGNKWYIETRDTIFSDSSHGEGNFWSDYTGSDGDGDGIGDTPYVIPGSAGSRDRCPLTLRSDIINALVDWGSRNDPWVRAPVPYFWI